MDRLVRFRLLGQEFPLYTDASEEDVQEILTLVESQLEAHKKEAAHLLPPNKLAILSSLNMAGKYVRLKREFEDYRKQVAELSTRLQQKIEETL